MAERRLSTTLRVRYRLVPWWLKVVVVFALSRVITTAIMLWFAAKQPANAWTGASPDYWQFSKLWDAHWYYIITLSGYPQELPITDDGHVGESAWAFMPVYPALIRIFVLGLGLDFTVVSVVITGAFALAAALVFFRVMNLVLPASTALFAVVLFCVAPLSPMLQVGYAESTYLFLLAVALYLLMTRRYWLMVPVIAVMALTRPSGLAFALAMSMHVVWRWWRDHKGADAFPPRERVASVVVAFFSGVMGLAWLLIAAATTGSLTAYLDTELAWRRPYIGPGELLPFTAWFEGAAFWSSQWGWPLWWGIVVLCLVIAGFFAALFSPAVKRLGPDLRFWSASYALYLLAVFFPQSSTFRLLMPLFPLLGAAAIPRSPWYRFALVALCIAGQVGWVHIAWWVDGYDWTPA